jgi:hypothetical protein
MGLLLISSLSILLVLMTVGIQRAQAMTQFYFDMPDDFEVTKGTTFEAAYFDDDGEGRYYIWNYTGLQGSPYNFSFFADLIPHEEEHDQIQSVIPNAESLHNRYEYKFAINDNITIGKNMELCVQASNYHYCEWPQPVDEFGRVLVDFAAQKR